MKKEDIEYRGFCVDPDCKICKIFRIIFLIAIIFGIFAIIFL